MHNNVPPHRRVGRPLTYVLALWKEESQEFKAGLGCLASPIPQNKKNRVGILFDLETAISCVFH